MYFAYFDESGDGGIEKSPTTWFVLNGVLVHETVWLQTLDSLIGLRRTLRDRYGIAPRDELKGANFRNGRGAFSKLGISVYDRMAIYEEIMESESELDVKTFSVAIHKSKAAARGWDARYAAWTFALQTSAEDCIDSAWRRMTGRRFFLMRVTASLSGARGWDARYAAWTFALQRLHRFCLAEDDRAAIFPDEGHGFFIRQRVRHMRRYNTVPSHFGPGSFEFKVERILEDPSDRRSQDSYFVQLADMNAYASHRSKYIDPRRDVKESLWDALAGPMGDVRLKEVNRVRGGPPGMVVYAP